VGHPGTSTAIVQSETRPQYPRLLISATQASGGRVRTFFTILLLSRPYMRSREPQFFTWGCSIWRIFWDASCLPTRLFLPAGPPQSTVRWSRDTRCYRHVTDAMYIGGHSVSHQRSDVFNRKKCDTLIFMSRIWRIFLCRGGGHIFPRSMIG